MEYLQYTKEINKWDTFVYEVLNLVINGIPSILKIQKVTETTS